MVARFDDVLVDRDGDVGVARWVGAFEAHTPGWSRWDLQPERTPRCVDEFLVLGSYGVLVPAVIGAWWNLTEGLARFVIPQWDGVSTCEDKGIAYRSVGWEYGIEERAANWLERDRGFVKARSYSRDSQDGRSRHSETPCAALVPVSTWAELVRVLPFGDQFNTSSLFAVPDTVAACTELVRQLGGSHAPTLRSLLTDAASSLAVVTQDDDQIPQLDSVLLAGQRVTEACLKTQTTALEERLAVYLREAAAASTDDEWNDAVAGLARIT